MIETRSVGHPDGDAFRVLFAFRDLGGVGIRRVSIVDRSGGSVAELRFEDCPLHEEASLLVARERLPLFARAEDCASQALSSGPHVLDLPPPDPTSGVAARECDPLMCPVLPRCDHGVIALDRTYFELEAACAQCARIAGRLEALIAEVATAWLGVVVLLVALIVFFIAALSAGPASFILWTIVIGLASALAALLALAAELTRELTRVEAQKAACDAELALLRDAYEEHGETVQGECCRGSRCGGRVVVPAPC
ncbi:MAG: hypothetical protein KF729_25975 [Sandaracinaceae bacterium]|nr:hypothetical protein [Sandaracinaceae bacterium]